jgi:transcriptional regulator with XRE-family HTH domain
MKQSFGIFVMTDAHRQIKIWLLQKKKTFRDLSEATDLTQTTIHNLLSGRTANQKSKQTLTNACGLQLWSDIPVTAKFITMPVGREIECATREEAAKDASEFGDFVKVVGRYIRWIKPMPAKLLS